MRNELGGLEVVGMLTIAFLLCFSLYINLVLEPECERKGFANVSGMGCYRIEDGVIIYEKLNEKN
jgi:hypothetical protein